MQQGKSLSELFIVLYIILNREFQLLKKKKKKTREFQLLEPHSHRKHDESTLLWGGLIHVKGNIHLPPHLSHQTNFFSSFKPTLSSLFLSFTCFLKFYYYLVILKEKCYSQFITQFLLKLTMWQIMSSGKISRCTWTLLLLKTYNMTSYGKNYAISYDFSISRIKTPYPR